MFKAVLHRRIRNGEEDETVEFYAHVGSSYGSASGHGIALAQVESALKLLKEFPCLSYYDPESAKIPFASISTTQKEELRLKVGVRVDREHWKLLLDLPLNEAIEMGASALKERLTQQTEGKKELMSFY